jgi:hypothetical protein
MGSGPLVPVAVPVQLSEAKDLAALRSRTWVKFLLVAAGGGRDEIRWIVICLLGW